MIPHYKKNDNDQLPTPQVEYEYSELKKVNSKEL